MRYFFSVFERLRNGGTLLKFINKKCLQAHFWTGSPWLLANCLSFFFACFYQFLVFVPWLFLSFTLLKTWLKNELWTNFRTIRTRSDFNRIFILQISAGGNKDVFLKDQDKICWKKKKQNSFKEQRFLGDACDLGWNHLTEIPVTQVSLPAQLS